MFLSRLLSGRREKPLPILGDIITRSWSIHQKLSKTTFSVPINPKLLIMNDVVLDVVVIGAGHAGLSASYYLKQYGFNHIVFERGKIAESWRSQRWDSFRLNTSNKLNILPGFSYTGSEPEGFCTAKEYASLLALYAVEFDLPVVENAKVLAVEKNEDGVFRVVVEVNQRINYYYAGQVIVASGAHNEIKVPSFAYNLSVDMQLHTSQYRNPQQLPEGAVLVAGSAQSGCQVAEDLLAAGRKVYLSTSMVGRIPRRYRGRDIMEWLLEMRFFDVRPEDVQNAAMLNMRPPQLTGVDGGHTISLQSLARQGAVILGKINNAASRQITLQPNAAANILSADQVSANTKGMIDGFILQNNLQAPPAEYDEADMPDVDAICASPVTSLDLDAHNITSVIWTTGFTGNFNYLPSSALDGQGYPLHKNGISPVDGLYYLGLYWLRTRKSALINGIKDDAAFIVEQVGRRAKKAERA
jgi:putative flavoprotein involved in K+ transport